MKLPEVVQQTQPLPGGNNILLHHGVVPLQRTRWTATLRKNRYSRESPYALWDAFKIITTCDDNLELMTQHAHLAAATIFSDFADVDTELHVLGRVLANSTEDKEDGHTQGALRAEEMRKAWSTTYHDSKTTHNTLTWTRVLSCSALGSSACSICDTRWNGTAMIDEMCRSSRARNASSSPCSS